MLCPPCSVTRVSPRCSRVPILMSLWVSPWGCLVSDVPVVSLWCLHVPKGVPTSLCFPHVHMMFLLWSHISMGLPVVSPWCPCGVPMSPWVSLQHSHGCPHVLLIFPCANGCPHGAPCPVPPVHLGAPLGAGDLQLSIDFGASELCQGLRLCQTSAGMWGMWGGYRDLGGHGGVPEMLEGFEGSSPCYGGRAGHLGGLGRVWGCRGSWGSLGGATGWLGGPRGGLGGVRGEIGGVITMLWRQSWTLVSCFRVSLSRLTSFTHCARSWGDTSQAPPNPQIPLGHPNTLQPPLTLKYPPDPKEPLRNPQIPP